MCYKETPVHEQKVGIFTLKIWNDPDPAINPVTDWDFLGHFYQFDNRIYSGLGRVELTNDKNPYPDFSSLAGSLLEYSTKGTPDAACFCLFFWLDQYGLRVQGSWTKGDGNFGCGRHFTGLYYITEAEIAAEWSTPEGKPDYAAAEKYMRHLLSTLDDYYQGAVYGWTVENTVTEEVVDSCWSYIGEWENSGCMEDSQWSLDGAASQEIAAQQFEAEHFHL